jgi:nodulation protein E
MARRRVAVTGLGVICALGSDLEQFWAALTAGRSGIGPIGLVDRSLLQFQNGACVPDFDSEAGFDRKANELLDRFAKFAALAAREAVARSGIEWTAALRERCAVVTGSCVGGQTTEDREFYQLYHEGRTRLHPLGVPRTMANAGASQIALELGVTGPVWTVSTACSSANHAIGQAFWMVRSGQVDLAIAGGSEAPFSLAHLKAWEALRVVSPDTCRPFSKNRRGLILGEGAAMLVLEPREAARARGVPILGELAGFGMSSDAHHITQPSSAGAVRAMRGALEDSRIRTEQVGYINAHGTGTLANDVSEVQAIRIFFGAHADRLAVSSTKSMHGHTLGAAGAIEAVATELALHHGILPPTANYEQPDPECDLDVVPNRARPAEVEYALSNSFAFGGLNAVLLFRSARG